MNNLNVINLLPIDVTYAPDGDLSQSVVYPASHIVARLTKDVGEVLEMDVNGVKWEILLQYPLGEVYIIADDAEDIEGNRFPFFKEEHGTIYLVNVVVAQKLAGRVDVFSPASGADGVLREDGRIVAITKFNQFV